MGAEAIVDRSALKVNQAGIVANLVLAFLLTFRLGEAQALKLVAPFMLDLTAKGGLGLMTTDVGFAYGTVGVISLTLASRTNS